MLSKGIFFLASFWASILLAAPAGTPSAPQLPVETFFRNPNLDQMRLSPDGKFVAGIGSSKGESMLFGIDLLSGERYQIAPGYINDVDWVSDRRLVYREASWGWGGLYAVDRSGSNRVVLHPPFWTFTGHVRAVDILCIPVESTD